MNNFEKWKQNLKIEDLQLLSYTQRPLDRVDIGCPSCPAIDVCHVEGDRSCIVNFREWAEQEAD